MHAYATRCYKFGLTWPISQGHLHIPSELPQVFESSPSIHPKALVHYLLRRYLSLSQLYAAAKRTFFCSQRSTLAQVPISEEDRNKTWFISPVLITTSSRGNKRQRRRDLCTPAAHTGIEHCIKIYALFFSSPKMTNGSALARHSGAFCNIFQRPSCGTRRGWKSGLIMSSAAINARTKGWERAAPLV